MAFFTQWENEPYILRTSFSGRVTKTDMKLVMLEYIGAAQELKDVYFILDFTEANSVPNELLQTPDMMQVLHHANTRWIAVVKPEEATSYMTKLLTRDKMKTFRDTESAVAFLQGMVRLDLDVDLTTADDEAVQV